MKRIIAAFCALICSVSIGATLSPVSLINPSGSTSGQAIISTGPSTAPAWGSITSGALAPVAANTVLGNFTNSSAAPAAFAAPSCSTANSALKYTSGTGLSCGTTFALTSGNLSQFAATTSAQLAGVLSDETGGSGVAVFNASPTFTGTVNVAAITATGAITPSQTAGIVGTTTNNNANAGAVGEYVTNTATGVSLTTNTTANITSISLTAGDWDVWGNFLGSPAGGASITTTEAAITTTSATMPGGVSGRYFTQVATTGAFLFPIGMVRLSLSSTTTVYLVARYTFSSGTSTADAFIGARRVR